MTASRLGRLGVLLLVFWVTADVSAYGFCTPSLPQASGASASVGTDHGDNSGALPVCCGAHHCFCCSSGTQIAAFALPFEVRAVFVAPSLQPRPADISASNTSPPPRF